jgi:hypothetical protein
VLGVWEILVKLFSVLFLGLLSFQLQAENLCPEAGIKGEEHWFVPEKSFTKESALKAAEELKVVVQQLDNGEDFFANNYGIDFESMIQNLNVTIKGYSYKAMAEYAIKNKLPDAQYQIDTFCEFLKNDAVVWH